MKFGEGCGIKIQTTKTKYRANRQTLFFLSLTLNSQKKKLIVTKTKIRQLLKRHNNYTHTHAHAHAQTNTMKFADAFIQALTLLYYIPNDIVSLSKTSPFIYYHLRVKYKLLANKSQEDNNWLQKYINMINAANFRFKLKKIGIGRKIMIRLHPKIEINYDEVILIRKKNTHISVYYKKEYNQKGYRMWKGCSIKIHFSNIESINTTHYTVENSVKPYAKHVINMKFPTPPAIIY